MEKTTNITLKVGESLARDAKVLAAKRGTSLSRLVARELERLVNEDQLYAAARRGALRRLKQGFDMKVDLTGSRADLHGREDLR